MYHKHVLPRCESRDSLERLRNDLNYCRTEERENGELSSYIFWIVRTKQGRNSPVLWGNYFLLNRTLSTDLKAMFTRAIVLLVVAFMPPSAVTVTFTPMTVV